MTPHKIVQETTGEKLLLLYNIVSTPPKVDRWRKVITLTSLESGKKFEGRLWWSSDDGYEMFWDGDAPDEASQPEFEYVIDGLTRQDYK